MLFCQVLGPGMRPEMGLPREPLSGRGRAGSEPPQYRIMVEFCPYDLVAICGPTASGKTRLGVELARRLDGEILSVDSRQVYRGLDLGSGKDLHEFETPEGPVRHHLIDIADPAEVYTVWRFMADFALAYRKVRARGRAPIAVGGTGLYLEAVLRGYRIPPTPPDETLRGQLRAQPLPVLLARLRGMDAGLGARVDAHNRERVVRALEIALHRSAAESTSGRASPLCMHPLVFAVRLERRVLRERIAARLEERLRRGLVDEVRGLLARGLAPARLHQLGLEYRYIGRYLAGELEYSRMCAQLRGAICRLAKRQDTYFRGMERRGVPIEWLEGADPAAAIQRIMQLAQAHRVPAAGARNPGAAPPGTSGGRSAG